MNCLWILLLLFCCKGNNERCDCNCGERPVIMPRENITRRQECDYPMPPFAPERGCECRATEMRGAEE